MSALPTHEYHTTRESPLNIPVTTAGTQASASDAMVNRRWFCMNGRLGSKSLRFVQVGLRTDVLSTCLLLQPKQHGVTLNSRRTTRSTMTLQLRPLLLFWISTLLLVVVESVCGFIPNPTIIQRRHSTRLFATDDASPSDDDIPQRIYFDIEVADKPVGRLVFKLDTPSPLPLHTENLVKLCKGSNRGIDPKAHYVGCQFDYTQDYIEDGMGRYRWGHVLRGRGRNAVGRADQPLSDPENQQLHTHTCFGGQYYGSPYQEGEYPGVLLTVPVVGPGYGSSRITIVRVGESPREWGDRLLLNSGVVGRLEGEESLETLHAMARQRQGPPTVVASGVLE